MQDKETYDRLLEDLKEDFHIIDRPKKSKCSKSKISSDIGVIF